MSNKSDERKKNKEKNKLLKLDASFLGFVYLASISILLM